MSGKENTNRVKNLGRRDFLKLLGTSVVLTSVGGLTPILNACSREPEIPSATKEKTTTETPKNRIRREAGEWSRSEVETLALEMQSESQFNDIASFGLILFDNQRETNPSISKLNPLFTDHKIKFSTLEDSGDSPMYINFIPTGNDREFTIVSKIDGTIEKSSAKTSLQIEELIVDSKYTKQYSDFALKFFAAQQMSTVIAAKTFVDFVIENIVSQDYIVPAANDNARKALEVDIITQRTFSQIPTASFIDMWGSFMMLPNFNLALEQGKFSSEEINSAFGLQKEASEVFLNNGVLMRSSTGRYEWTSDPVKFLEAWTNLAKELLTKPPATDRQL